MPAAPQQARALAPPLMQRIADQAAREAMRARRRLEPATN